MRKIMRFLLTVTFVLGIAAPTLSPQVASLYAQIEELALYLVPDEIEELIATLSEKLA